VPRRRLRSPAAKPATAAKPSAGSAIRTMDDYEKSPQAAARKQKFKTPEPYEKPAVKYQKGPTLHLTLATKVPPKFKGENVKGVTPKKGKITKTKSDGMDCVTTDITLTATSSSFSNNDYSGTVSNIYPGACYTFAHLTDGSWQSQAGARNPITITTNNPNTKGPSSLVVANPSQSTVNAGVAKLFSGFPRSSATQSLSYEVTNTENAAAYDMAIGGSASGYGVDVSNKYDQSTTSKHVYLTIDAQKSLFNIDTFPPDNGFFTDEKVEGTPYLSFISSVTYGIRVLANADLEFDTAADADHFKFSYSGFGVNADFAMDEVSSSKNYKATINGYVIGGPGNLGVAYDMKGLKAQIEKAMAGTNFQNARLISYVVRDMGNEIINTYSATDEFAERSCIPAAAGPPEIASVQVDIQSGADGKEPQTQFHVTLLAGKGLNEKRILATYYAPFPMNVEYQHGSTHTVFLNKVLDSQLKNEDLNYNMDDFIKHGGGTLIINNPYYNSGQPGATGGINYDIWIINGIKLTINYKPQKENPNPKPNIISWTLGGSNAITLDSRNAQSTGMLYFDKSFQQSGQQ
jgi:hypothetical protein